METQASSSGAFIGTIIHNPKNEICNAIELRSRVVPLKQRVGEEKI